MISESHRHFLAAAKSLNFTQAAREVFRTQSAISQSIAGLEAELGVALFYRDGRRLRLTEAGRLLQEYTLRVDGIAREFAESLSEQTGLLKGDLRIGCSSTTACYWLPPILSAFRERYPGIGLHILNGASGALVSSLHEDRCDIALLTLPIDETGLDIAIIETREDVLICSPDSAHLKKRPPVLQDLAGLPFLMPAPSSQLRTYLDARFAEAGVQVLQTMEIRGLEIIKRYVEQDFGLSIVPLRSVQREINDKRLEAWPLFERNHHRCLASAKLGSRRNSAVVVAFEALIRGR